MAIEIGRSLRPEKVAPISIAPWAKPDSAAGFGSMSIIPFSDSSSTFTPSGMKPATSVGKPIPRLTTSPDVRGHSHDRVEIARRPEQVVAAVDGYDPLAFFRVSTDAGRGQDAPSP